MTERRKDGITEGQGESSIAPLFQSGAIITIFVLISAHAPITAHSGRF